MIDTIDEAKSNLSEAQEHVDDSILHDTPAEEIVADKGYHSNEVLRHLKAQGHRTYVSEPDRGRRRWRGDREVQEAVYANRRRIQGDRGKELLRRRGELLERPFAHALNAGGMRRTHLRGRPKILKRVLVHFAALNLALAMRIAFGAGTPKEYADRVGRGFSWLHSAIRRLMRVLERPLATLWSATRLKSPISGLSGRNQWRLVLSAVGSPSSTGC